MRIEFSPDRSLYLFEPRWFESSQGRIHYSDEATGPPLLLRHGEPEPGASLYRHIVRASRDRFWSVANDYLGFGLSDRPEGYGYTIDEPAAVVGSLLMISRGLRRDGPRLGRAHRHRRRRHTGLHDLLVAPPAPAGLGQIQASTTGRRAHPRL
jgi:hypothetical protein